MLAKNADPDQTAPGAKNADSDQTAPPEQSDQGLHFFAYRVLSKYLWNDTNCSHFIFVLNSWRV